MKLFFAMLVFFAGGLGDSVAYLHASEIQIALDNVGNAVGIWKDLVGSNYVIKASTMLAGGPWGEPQIISSLTEYSDNPRIAINQQGRAVAVWQEFFDSQFAIKSAQMDLGETWGPDVFIASPEEGSNFYYPQVGIDDLGNCIAIWLKLVNGQSNQIMTASFSAGMDSWGSQNLLGNSSSFFKAPCLGSNVDGTFIAAWENEIEKSSVIQVRMATGLTWGEIISFSQPDANSFSPHVALNNNGQAILAWHASGSNYLSINSSFYSSGEGWSEPVALSNPGIYSKECQICINDFGFGAVAWTAFDSNSSIIQSSLFSFSSSLWSPPVTLSPVNMESDSVEISMDNSNLIIAVWQTFDGTKNMVQAATYSPMMAQWGMAQNISDASGGVLPQVQLNQSNKALTAWLTDEGLDSIIETALFTLESGWGVPTPIPD